MFFNCVSLSFLSAATRAWSIPGWDSAPDIPEECNEWVLGNLDWCQQDLTSLPDTLTPTSLPPIPLYFKLKITPLLQPSCFLMFMAGTEECFLQELANTWFQTLLKGLNKSVHVHPLLQNKSSKLQGQVNGVRRCWGQGERGPPCEN